MKALTLHQPYASLVALGVKRIETRSWATSYRGPIAIHAGAGPPWGVGVIGEWLAQTAARERGRTAPWRLYNVKSIGPDDPPSHPLPLGAVVATATLADVVPIKAAGLTTRADADATRVTGAVVADFEGAAYYRPGVEPGELSRDVSDQLPYGDFTPGRFAWLLEDVKPTTERCPACWGAGGFKADTTSLYGIPGGEDWSHPCDLCNPHPNAAPPGDGFGCDPVPAKGRQGLWEWAPC
jgi:activating signal cointegrator 1